MAFKLLNHRNNKYIYLSELGTRFNLSFSSHMVLADKILALDGIKRKLLVAGFMEKQESVQVIDLNEIKAVSLKKTYDSIDAGALALKGMEQFINSIHLEFQYRLNNIIKSLVFYRKNLHIVQDLAKHERNAKSWQMILSKLVSDGRQNREEVFPV